MRSDDPCECLTKSFVSVMDGSVSFVERCPESTYNGFSVALTSKLDPHSSLLSPLSSSSLTMSLESGTYTIFSKLDNAPIGRRNPEDLSLNPKGIFKRPRVGPHDGPSTVSSSDLSHKFQLLINDTLLTLHGMTYCLLSAVQMLVCSGKSRSSRTETIT